jgi:hypothetical protein
MKWIESVGGPLILIPQSVLSEWHGASLETSMAGDDYQRACAISSYVGEIPVGGGTGLVLGDAPDRTAVIASEFGPALLRWGCADSEEAILEAVRTNLGRAEVIGELEHQVGEPTHLLIDSAFSGTDFAESLELRLAMGTYRVMTRRHTKPRVEYLAHVFQKC